MHVEDSDSKKTDETWLEDGKREDCSIGSTSQQWLRFRVFNYPQTISHLQMSGICHDGRSESATSRIVHAPVEAQQQGKPSVSDFQVPADGCELPLCAKMCKASHNSSTLACFKVAGEEVRRLRCNVDTGTGHLGHPPHPHFCAMQATRSSGCRASTCWRVHDAPAIGVAGHLESHGEAQLGGLDNLGLQLSRTESLIPVR
ncbi:hypothetical protein MUK42_21352 [Musa troglodytarum]|uniref:Uncharacterized protein n=1 Tax=Musa troglodytarum TaxID=320322 RepID=A0A9E7FUF8_9LILI|nr:hypothetical protein MUK42_21352 [Musa troglodytarum]